MKRIWSHSLILFFFLFCTDLAAGVPRDPDLYFFEQSLGDLTEELALAKQAGKKGIFIFFEMDECPFCHRMKNTVLNQPGVQDYFKKYFHSLAVDIEGDIEMVDFAGEEMTQKQFSRQYRVRATPVLAFFDLTGNLVLRYTGATSGTEEFLWMAEYYTQEIYKMKDDQGREIRFSRFKRMKKTQQSLN